MRYLLVALLAGCLNDIALIEKVQPIDTGESLVDTADTSWPEPASEPGSSPTSEPSTETDAMTDLTIGYAEVSLTQIACPACMGVYNEFDIFANLKLHQPTNGEYNGQLTPVGSCVTQELGSYVSSTPLQVGGSASFNSIQLYPSGQSEWTNSNLQEYQIPRNTWMTVQTEAGTIPNAFQTLEGFDDIQPWELRYVDPSYAFAAVVSRNGTTFSWTPVIPNAQFEVLIAVYSPDGSQMLGLVSCMQNDVGYLTVPGQYVQQYPTWALTAIYLTRHKTDRQPAYEFNGWIESHQSWTVLGTGHIE
jgi:hypothetical protein